MENQLIIGLNGYVVSLDPMSGKENWRTKLSEGLFSVTRGSNVSVVQYDQMVLVGCQGHVFGLDTNTGKKLWHNELRGAGHGDISLSINGVSTQYIEKTVREPTHSKSSHQHA
ncbi:hypothetical protein FG475_21295 [Vibrio navarrensis]|nr:hypothetical protein [Vibrio navarrensis]